MAKKKSSKQLYNIVQRATPHLLKKILKREAIDTFKVSVCHIEVTGDYTI